MKSNTLKIVINRPAAEVFEFTTNPANTDKWFADTGKERTDEWPVKLGTHYINDYGTLTVSEFEPGKLFTLTKPGKFFVRYVYKNLACGTELTYYEESLDDDLDSITDMTPFNKLKELMESGK